jgi:uncharacterized membrane protein YccC
MKIKLRIMGFFCFCFCFFCLWMSNGSDTICWITFPSWNALIAYLLINIPYRLLFKEGKTNGLSQSLCMVTGDLFAQLLTWELTFLVTLPALHHSWALAGYSFSEYFDLIFTRLPMAPKVKWSEIVRVSVYQAVCGVKFMSTTATTNLPNDFTSVYLFNVLPLG